MDKLLKRKEVEKMTGLSRATIYRRMNESRFPRPMKSGFSHNSPVRWKTSDVEKWISNSTKQ